MRVYLMRHGAAAWTTPDFERQLTDSGRLQSQRLIKEYQDEWASITDVLVSPYPRAQQSAELLKPMLSAAVEWSTCDLLQPESSINSLCEMLNQRFINGATADSSERTLMLVAHNPLLSHLLNRLLGQPEGFYSLGTSAIAAIDLPVFARDCAELSWVEKGF